MSGAWTFTGQVAPHGGLRETVTLVEETTFCLSDRSGDCTAGSAHGLVFLDTRFLSFMTLRVEDQPVEALGTAIDEPFEATFLGRVTPPGTSGDTPFVVTRRRRIGRGLVERIQLRNHGLEARTLRVELTIGTDFADLFEMKEQRPTLSRVTNVEALASTLRITGDRDGVNRWLTVRGEPSADLRLVGGGGAFTWVVDLDPQASFEACIEVTGGMADELVEPRHRCGGTSGGSGPARRMGSWRAAVPEVESDDDRLVESVQRAIEDLGGLRIADPDDPDTTVIAAGAPWFMTLFGRDSLLTGYMAMIVDPGLALGALRTLARLQGRVEDEATEEEPGRILHEIRFADRPSWRFADGSCYYGSVDATPLFVVVLGELARWGAGRRDVDALLPAADAALDWIDAYGDRDGDGFVEYERRTPTGLENQGWKDSWDAVRFADGRFASGPIALAEVQGYVYAAYLARAALAEQRDDHERNQELLDRAHALKQSFNEAFWIDELGYYAMALDGDKRPVDALVSNMGHCLWSGIVDVDHASAVADRLLEPEMFSGWGVRTMASSSASYNPVSYHNGSVWPHDNALIVAGLVRYGYVDHARTVVDGLLEAGSHLDGRLPELLTGNDRASLSTPAVYPTSCVPQAWSSATPLLLIRSLLRLEPDAIADELWIAPALGPGEHLRIAGVPFRGGRIAIDATSDSCEITGVGPDVRVHHSAAPS